MAYIVLGAEALTITYFLAYVGLVRGLLADGAGLRPARVDAVGRRLRDSARLALMLGIPAMFVAELIHQLWPSG